MKRKEPIKSYKDLDVWKKGIEIVDCVYQITAHFPSQEKFVLSAQMQKAAISIPSNIAEGYARQHRKEFQQFCAIALGSCSELETQSIIAYRRKYVPEINFFGLQEYLDHESRMLASLIQRLRSST